MSKEIMTTHTDHPKPELPPHITVLLLTKEVQQLQAYGEAMAAWAREQALKIEPVFGKNYEQGLWSRRNLEAYLEDQGEQE